MNIEAFKQVNLNDITTSLIDSSDLNFDNCTLTEVIGFLHKISRDPHTCTLNLAFTEHITNALIKVREEKLRVEASIPMKLEDGWDPMIKIKLNNFLGMEASTLSFSSLTLIRALVICSVKARL